MSIKIPETEVDEATLTMIIDNDLIPVVCLGGDPDQLALLTDQIMSWAFFRCPLMPPRGSCWAYSSLSNLSQSVMSGWMVAPMTGRSEQLISSGDGNWETRREIEPFFEIFLARFQLDPVVSCRFCWDPHFAAGKIVTRTSCCASSFWSMAKWNSRRWAMQL